MVAAVILEGTPVSGLTITEPGVGCTSSPTVQITPTDGGAGATASVTVGSLTEETLECSQRCDPPTAPENAHAHTSAACQDASLGDLCQLSCDIGYGASDGLTTRTLLCQLPDVEDETAGNGGAAFTWAHSNNPGGLSLMCKRSCTELTAPWNATVVASTVAAPNYCDAALAGDSCEMVCDDGFEQSTGDLVRQCDETAEFSGEEATWYTCRRQCPDYPPPTGTMLPTSVSIAIQLGDPDASTCVGGYENQTCAYKCAPGLRGATRVWGHEGEQGSPRKPCLPARPPLIAHRPARAYQAQPRPRATRSTPALRGPRMRNCPRHL